MKLKKAGLFLLGALTGGLAATVAKESRISKLKKDVLKYLTLFRTMNQYVVTKQLHKDLSGYFAEKGIRTIAVYGMSHIGQRIIDDLENSDVRVLFGIDKRADRLTYEMDIYKPEDEFPDVDAIVVAAYDFDEIEEALSAKVSCKILSFEDIIYHL